MLTVHVGRIFERDFGNQTFGLDSAGPAGSTKTACPSGFWSLIPRPHSTRGVCDLNTRKVMFSTRTVAGRHSINDQPGVEFQYGT
jgi:hypothetical protein